MAQSKEFVDGSHALKELSHDLGLLESKNASLQGAVEGLSTENAKLRELVRGLWYCSEDGNRVHCDRCPLGEVEGHLTLTCEKMMSELGIEVDG